jgi:ubiquinone/menaquinone biosynthesis C-methylase UbiE
MLQKARHRLRRSGIQNVGYTQADAALLPFRAESFDVAFVVAVLGEVPDPKACLASIALTLRREGVLVVAELPGDPDALSEQRLRDLVESTGVEFVESIQVSRARVTRFRRQDTKD